MPVVGLRFRSEANRLERLVAGTDTLDVEEVSPGPVVVEGVVRKHRKSIESPLDGGECVYARYQRFRRDDTGVPTGSDPVESTVAAVPFLVEDGTGSVLVDPEESVYDDGGPVVVSGANTDRYYGTEDPEAGELVEIPPGDGKEFEALSRARNELGAKPEWVHVQSTIRPGDEVYVLGDASESQKRSVRHVVTPADDGTFLLSDMSRSALREQLDRQTGAIDRRFWAFVLIGLIAVVLVALVVAGLADSFLI